MSNCNYYALIQGGIGPDVWDNEVPLSAVDFRDACNQALAKAEELGGQVTSLEQDDYRADHPITRIEGPFDGKTTPPVRGDCPSYSERVITKLDDGTSRISYVLLPDRTWWDSSTGSWHAKPVCWWKLPQ